MKWHHRYIVIEAQELEGQSEPLKLIMQAGKETESGYELNLQGQSVGNEGCELVSVVPTSPACDKFYLFFKRPIED